MYKLLCAWILKSIKVTSVPKINLLVLVSYFVLESEGKYEQNEFDNPRDYK